jgi:cobalt/nickel transport system permease protein
MEAVFVTVKVLTGTACLYMISLTTPVYEVVGTLRRWHLPEVMLELMILMYRFLFGLLELYEQMKQSAQARLGDIGIRQGYRSFFGICANLLVLAFRRASDSFNAMEARGYDGELRFLEEKKLVTGRQRLGIVLYGVLLAAGLLAERMWSI